MMDNNNITIIDEAEEFLASNAKSFDVLLPNHHLLPPDGSIAIQCI